MAVYKYETWTFVPDNQELIYSDGKKEQLPTRLSNCLLTLISAQGETVSYDELLSKVWGTTHRDASTISSVISELRKLIGCGEQGKKIIVTIPKRGYRFTPSLAIIESNELTYSAQTDSSTPEVVTTEVPLDSSEVTIKKYVFFSSNIKKYALLTSLFLSAFLVSFLLINSKITPTATSQKIHLSGDYEVLTHESGREDEFDVSKDGQWLVYVNKSTNALPSLIVKELITGETKRLIATGDYYFGSPVFANDASQIVFHKQFKQKCEVWLADFSSKQLAKNKTKRLTDCGKGGFWSTTGFSKDGNHVYFSRANALTDPFKIHRLDLRTGFERGITSPTSSGRGDYAFSVSPSGNQLAVVRNVLWQETHVLLHNTQNAQIKPIIELPYLIDRVAWLNEQQLAWCDENKQIWSYDLASNTRSLLAKTKFSCHYPVMAFEQLYAIKKSQIKNAIWQLSANSDNQFSVQPTINSRYYDFNAMFGPNNSLFFISNRSGEEKLWQKTEQGMRPHKNIQLPKHASELEFSAETNSFYGLAEKRLFRYDLNVGEVEWLSKNKHEVFNFSITDNGTLLFSEGKNEYWTLKSVDLFSLKITELEINAFSAREANGQLYFTQFHQNGLWKKDLSTGKTKKLIDNIDIKFVTFWDILNKEKLIWATDNKFKIYNLNTGHLITDALTFEGHVGYVKCSDQRSTCIYSLKENDETEIIKFK